MLKSIKGKEDKKLKTKEMKHLKNFDLVTENIEGGELYATSWTPAEGEGDYTLTFSNAEGAEITADFKESKAPIGWEGKGKAYGAFEMLPGTSSDGKDYVAEVQYKEVEADDLEVTGFVIFEM